MTTSLPRSFVIPLQHMCRAVICARLADYNHVDALPLPLAPAKFRDFLKEYHYKVKLRTIQGEQLTKEAAQKPQVETHRL